MTLSSSVSSATSRSIYLSRLRRAFLLRVHPDRFRHQSPQIRRQQAALVQALSNRLIDPDFVSWQQQHQPSSPPFASNHKYMCATVSSYPYRVERRDGSYLHATLTLSDPVDRILASMAQALEQSGAASLPPPPTSSSTKTTSQSNANNHHLESNAHIRSSSSFWSSNTTSTASSTTIDHRYDKISRQGRDLQAFLLQQTTPQQLQQDVNHRRQCRMDAQACASQVRQVYQFQVVNATSLGWSSESVAVLLSRLLLLHEDHAAKLNVSSFYPLRLEITSAVPTSAHSQSSRWLRQQQQQHYSDSFPSPFLSQQVHVAQHEEDHHPSLDLYGGILKLHPAATPIQWLESLQLVTPESLQVLQHNRSTLTHRVNSICHYLSRNHRMEVQLIKGHSCTSKEYYNFIQHLYGQLVVDDNAVEDASKSDSRELQTSSSSLTLEPIRVAVEGSTHASRRKAVVTPEGWVRISTRLSSVNQLMEAIAPVATMARQQRQQQLHDQQQCQHLMQELQWQVGLQKIARYHTTRVTYAQFKNALSRLRDLLVLGSTASASSASNAEDDASHNRTPLLQVLAGHSLAIASSGHFCHIGDDGSIVIPHDWR